MQLERQENLFFGLFVLLDKFCKFMKITFIIWAMCVALSCSTKDSTKIVSFQNENVIVRNQSNNGFNKNLYVNEKSSKTLDCNKPEEYNLIVIEDPDRNIEDTVTMPKLLNIMIGNETKATIKIPTDSDVNSFSLDSTEKTKKGFEISIQYGTRYYYEKRFDFVCEEGSFYFYKMETEIRDKNHPENWDEPDKKIIQITPKLPIEKFSLFDYLGNE